MRYEVEIGGRLRLVTVTRVGDSFAITVDGRPRHVEATRIDAQRWSLVVSPGNGSPGKNDTPGARASFDVVTTPDAVPGALTVHVGGTPVAAVVNGRRRRGRGDDRAGSGSGPQRITAPMPGKVVKVLVTPGDAVHARQPIVVVEAMKMENELRAGREGTVTEIHAREGASVDAGALLVVIQ